jgi:hypothetical protein
MALTAITAEIEALTGVTDATTNYIVSAQKFVISSIPKNYTWTFVHQSDKVSDNPVLIKDGSTFIDTDSILGVVRGAYNCTELDQRYRGMVESLDTTSLYYPTNKHPKYLKNHSTTISIYPAPDATDKGYVLFADYLQVDDDSDLRNAVIFYAASKEFLQLAIGKLVAWADVSAPAVPSNPDFGADLSMSSITLPTAPSIDKTVLDTTAWVAPVYVAPSLQLADFPTLSWEFPSSPVAPSIASISVADFSGAAPIFEQPAMPSLDFTGASAFVTGEDPEMVGASLSVINGKVGEFQAHLAKSQAQFNRDQSIYQATIQEKIQEAQLDEGFEGRKLQKFQAELSDYGAEVNKIIQGNNNQTQEWQSEHQTKIGKFNADIQVQLNIFNGANVDFQSEMQKSIQNATFEEVEEKNKLTKFQAEMSKYQAEVQREVQTYQQSFTKNSAEYSSTMAKFQAELSKYQADVAKKTQEIQTGSQLSGVYEKQADKFYSWATAEVQKFIANNERTTSRAMTQQAIQQGG